MIHGDLSHHNRASMFHGDLSHHDRASTFHGDLSHHDRASTWHGDHRLLGRASMAHGEQQLHDRAEVKHGDVYHQDRARIAAENGDVCQRARALSARDGVYHGARAEDELLYGESEQGHGGGAQQRGRSRHDRETVEDGDLKAVPIQFPTLPPPEGRDASLEAGDWIIQLGPLVGDLSKNAACWWRKVVDATAMKYDSWLHADPLSRLRIAAPDNAVLSTGFERLDQRVTSLLLQSVPKAIKDEVIAARELTTTQILFRVLRTYQPGGLVEKSRLLEDLTTISTVKTANDFVAALRLWKRKASRASELNAQLPDPLLMIRTLDGIARPVVESSSQASFRIASFRMNHSLDIRPSLSNVWLFYDLLLAEAEVAVHSTSSATVVEPKTPSKPTVKVMQTPSTGGKSSTSTASSAWPCKFWLTDGGCRQGQRCRWPHLWEGCTDKSSRCWTCSSNQHQQQDCPYKSQVKPPVGGDGEGVGAGGKASEKGRGKGKGKGKSKQEGQKTAQKEEGAQNDVKKEDNVGKNATAEEDPKSKCTAGDNGSGNNKKVESGGSGSNTNELLQEATKLLKSLHLPAAKKITLQELGNPQLGPSDLMLLDSGATHSLRRAKSWEEWEGSRQTVVALAQGTTSKLRIKPGTETLLSTPDDDSFGNCILPMGALTKIGYEVSWSGGDCRVRSSGGEKIEVQVVNGCPMVEKQVGTKMMDQLEHHSCVATARIALVRAILQQPGLMSHMADLDTTTLLSIMLKKEFPDLPDSICAKIVPKETEVQGDQLPWNRRLRRRMMKARRIVLHLFSGSDEKTWKQLEDANTMVICLDRVLNPKMDMLNDHIMLFLMKLATTGALQAVLGGPPCRTVSACRYTNDNGPAPVRSEEEPYGLASLSPQQRQWVEDDIAMFFRMKLIYMIAVHHKPDWCDKVLFGLEQPQDPKEYRSEQDIQQHQYMSVWRMASWQHFQEKYKLMRTSFEQGAFGHVKPKPTTIAHNINGLEELQGAKAPRDCHQGGWKDRPLQERIQESATWAQWAPGLKAAIIEGLRRQFQKMDAGRCHLGVPGNAEEATWDSECDNPKPLHQQPKLCPLSEVALAKWKAHVLHDHQPMRLQSMR